MRIFCILLKLYTLNIKYICQKICNELDLKMFLKEIRNSSDFFHNLTTIISSKPLNNSKFTLKNQSHQSNFNHH